MPAAGRKLLHVEERIHPELQVLVVVAPIQAYFFSSREKK